jgi:peroxiredoxin
MLFANENLYRTFPKLLADVNHQVAQRYGVIEEVFTPFAGAAGRLTSLIVG